MRGSTFVFVVLQSILCQAQEFPEALRGHSIRHDEEYRITTSVNGVPCLFKDQIVQVFAKNGINRSNSPLLSLLLANANPNDIDAYFENGDISFRTAIAWYHLARKTQASQFRPINRSKVQPSLNMPEADVNEFLQFVEEETLCSIPESWSKYLRESKYRSGYLDGPPIESIKSLEFKVPNSHIEIERIDETGDDIDVRLRSNDRTLWKQKLVTRWDENESLGLDFAAFPVLSRDTKTVFVFFIKAEWIGIQDFRLDSGKSRLTFLSAWPKSGIE